MAGTPDLEHEWGIILLHEEIPFKEKSSIDVSIRSYPRENQEPSPCMPKENRRWCQSHETKKQEEWREEHFLLAGKCRISAWLTHFSGPPGDEALCKTVVFFCLFLRVTPVFAENFFGIVFVERFDNRFETLGAANLISRYIQKHFPSDAFFSLWIEPSVRWRIFLEPL